VRVIIEVAFNRGALAVVHRHDEQQLVGRLFREPTPIATAKVLLAIGHDELAGLSSLKAWPGWARIAGAATVIPEPAAIPSGRMASSLHGPCSARAIPANVSTPLPCISRMTARVVAFAYAA
jgi:hypothetical protein